MSSTSTPFLSSLLSSTPIQSVRPIYPQQNSDKPPFINIKTGKRKDGRTCDKFRDVFMQTGVIKQARGSAYIEFHKSTKVICAVYGPRQISAKNEFSDKGSLQCEYRVATFSHKRRQDPSKNIAQRREEEKQYGIYLREALESSLLLEKYPKSVIDIYCFVLEDNGSALSAAITCASLALADAGIEMIDLVSACSTSELEGQIVVDPTITEQTYATGGMVCGYMSNVNEVTQLTQVGDMTLQKVNEAMDLCIDGCIKLHQLMQQCLLQKFVK
ncbi:hypothetical protein ABK040_011521 [Willaertia magna]